MSSGNDESKNIYLWSMFRNKYIIRLANFFNKQFVKKDVEHNLNSALVSYIGQEKSGNHEPSEFLSKSETLPTKLKTTIFSLVAILLVISTIVSRSGSNESLLDNTVIKSGSNENLLDNKSLTPNEQERLKWAIKLFNTASKTTSVPTPETAVIQTILNTVHKKIKTVGDVIKFLPQFMSRVVDRVPILTTGKGLVLLSAMVSMIGFLKFWPEIKNRYQLLQKKTNPTVKVVSKKPRHYRSKNNKKKL